MRYNHHHWSSRASCIHPCKIARVKGRKSPAKLLWQVHPWNQSPWDYSQKTGPFSFFRPGLPPRSRRGRGRSHKGIQNVFCPHSAGRLLQPPTGPILFAGPLPQSNPYLIHHQFPSGIRWMGFLPIQNQPAPGFQG